MLYYESIEENFDELAANFSIFVNENKAQRAKYKIMKMGLKQK